jgi:tRNA modification GTPase
MFVLADTIAAIASAPGGAARGIVRLSGPKVVEIVAHLFHPTDPAIDLSAIRHPASVAGQIEIPAFRLPPSAFLSVSLFLWPNSQSYTRQPLAEFHVIGSPPLLDSLLRTICSSGARLARPGEFTLRAFLAGRIDLTQAEAVLGVVDAADRRSLDAALTQLAGGLSHPLNRLRDNLLSLLADLEAGLDFAEEDITFVGRSELKDRLTFADEQLQSVLGQLQSRGALTDLPRVVLVGPPNVGKSSLFNALIGNCRALVSTIPGTTRDYLTATIDAGGLLVELIDTAGLHEPERTIDVASQTVTKHQHAQADLRLLCLDVAQSAGAFDHLCDPNSLLIFTKCDLAAPPTADSATSRRAGTYRLPPTAHATSSRTGLGIDKLRAAIRDALSKKSGGDCVAATATRIVDSVRLAIESVGRAQALVADHAGDELIAAEIRTTLAELGKIVGAVYTEDLLDRIFSRFCIGK